MAMEIRPIPVLTGKEAERFVRMAEAAKNHPRPSSVKMTDEEYNKIMAKAQLG